MTFHQSHQLQTRDLNPKEIIHGRQHLNQGVTFEHKTMVQHLPLNAQWCGKHQLIFELERSYLHHHLYQTVCQ